MAHIQTTQVCVVAYGANGTGLVAHAHVSYEEVTDLEAGYRRYPAVVTIQSGEHGCQAPDKRLTYRAD